MEENSFKIGDKVRIISKIDKCLFFNKIGTIIKTNDDFNSVIVNGWNGSAGTKHELFLKQELVKLKDNNWTEETLS